MTSWFTVAGAKTGYLLPRHPNLFPMTPTLPDLSSNVNIISSLIKLQTDTARSFQVPPPQSQACARGLCFACFIHWGVGSQPSSAPPTQPSRAWFPGTPLLSSPCRLEVDQDARWKGGSEVNSPEPQSAGRSRVGQPSLPSASPSMAVAFFSCSCMRSSRSTSCSWGEQKRSHHLCGRWLSTHMPACHGQ